MRYWNDEAISKARETKNVMYTKLANYVPDDKLNSNDIQTLMFILRQYDIELSSIQADRKYGRIRRTK